MPEYHLPDGPVKVRIRNKSGNRDIIKVRVGVGGEGQHALVEPSPVNIGQAQQVIADNTADTQYANLSCACVTLIDDTGAEHTRRCCFDACRVGLVTVTWMPDMSIFMTVLKYPDGSGAVDNPVYADECCTDVDHCPAVVPPEAPPG